MKKMKQFALSAMAIVILIAAGCSKERTPVSGPVGTGGTGQHQDSTYQQPPPTEYPDSLKHVYAGNDIIVELPAVECVLHGGSSHINWDSATFSWRKISGPESFTLDSANSFYTRLHNLQQGIYQFEFKITDKKGYTGADTMMVIVGHLPPNPQEIIFTKLTWITPWFNDVEIPNFYKSVPQGIFYKIFIRRSNSSDWIEVKHESTDGSYDSNQLYEYFIIDWQGSDMYTFGSLYVTYYGNDISDHPDVKILY